MGYHKAKPSFPLSLFVKQYWAIDNSLDIGETHIQRIIPNGLMELTFYFENKPTTLDNSKQILENSILNGHPKSYFDMAITGQLSLFSVSFQPYGAKMFFGIPSNEFSDQIVPLKYIIKDINELESCLYETTSFECKIKIIEKFLINQLNYNYKEYEIDRITHSILLINQSKGQIDIDTLSSASCLSRKQYERTFLSYIGISPKQFLRTIRFQNSLCEKQRNKNLSLTALSYLCGYYDQSHMINEFKNLSGKTPSQFFSECEPYSDYFIP